jgi:hypothetical protein
MGVNQSPDVAQETMESLFRDLDEVNVYINDVGCFSNSWDKHLPSLNKNTHCFASGKLHSQSSQM